MGAGVKYMDTEMLRKYAPQHLVNQLDPEGYHVIHLSLLHSEDEVRVFVLAKMFGRDAPFQIDTLMPLEVFNSLPTANA